MAAKPFIDSTYLTRDSMAVQAVDQVGNGIVAAFDKIMTKAVNEGALLDAAGKVADGVSNTADKMMASRSLPSPDATPGKAANENNEKSAPLLSRAQDLTVCPGGPDVAAQVSNSGLNLAAFKAESMVNVPEAALTGHHDMSVSKTAMVTQSAAQFHEKAEQLEI